MPKYEKDFKRLIRERMTRTGESYSTARAQLEARPGLPLGQPNLGEVLALAHQMPQWLRRMYARSTSWVDAGVRDEAVGRPSRSGDGSDHAQRSEHETWFEIDDVAWARHNSRLVATRWREETTTLASGEPKRRVFGGDGTGSWQDGPNGLVSRRGPMMGQRPDVIFSCDNVWASWPAPLEVGGVVDVHGRAAVVVSAVTPVRPSRPSPFTPPLGDRHELVVDLETGLLLRLSNFFGKRKIDEHEVVEFSFPDGLDDSLFALPPERPVVEVPETQRFTVIGQVGQAVPFPVFAPMWLPDGYQFGMGMMMGQLDGTVSVSLSFVAMSRSEGGPDTINVNSRQMESDDADQSEWIEHQSNGLSIRVSSGEPEAIRRQARVSLEGTQVSVYANLALDDLLHLVGSLASLPR